MDIASLKTVTLVAQHGSFAAAARVLDVDPSSVSRTVANLEAELGLRLFQRSTRTLSVTEAGATYIARIVPLLEEFERAEDLARNATRSPSGTLKLTASVAFAQECIVPHLNDFMRRFPDIALELIPTDTNVDLRANNIDLAIRLAPAPSGELISTKLCDTRYVVCAAPGYLGANEPLRSPQDLVDHDCLCFALPEYRTRWRFRPKGGAPFDVPVAGRLVISNALALRSATRDGLGPALLPDWLVGRDIANGSLIDLFPHHDCTATEFDTAAWMLYPSRAYLPQKVRVMIDFLRKTLA